MSRRRYRHLIDAIRDKADVMVLTQMLDDGMDVNKTVAVDGDRWRPLTAAICWKAGVDVVKLLLDKGADPNLQDGVRWSPLRVAITEESGVDVMKRLLDKGADPILQGGDGWSPLTAAILCEAGVDVLQLLLDNLQDGVGWSSLTTAIRRGAGVDVDVVKLLLQHGADASDLPDGERAIILKGVVKTKNAKLLHNLIDSGWDGYMRAKPWKRCVDIALSLGDDKEGQDVIAAIHKKPPPESVMSADEWYRRNFDLGRDMIRLATKLLESESSPYEALKTMDPEILHVVIDAGFDSNRTARSGKRYVDIALSLGDDKKSRDVIAAIHRKPPLESVMSADEWYRRNFYLGRDMIRLAIEQPELESSPDTGYTFCRVKAVDQSSAREKLQDKEEVYMMSSRPRGRAIIINIREFYHKPRKIRLGSEHDVSRLATLFEQLGFEVECWETKDECTLEKLKSKMEEEKKRDIHKNADAFVLAIMSHGDGAGNLQSSDEKKLNVTDDLVTWFDGDEWPVMRGKPKIFFVQACRGGDGAYVDDSCDAAVSKPLTARAHQLHPKNDIVKIHGTYEGYSALRMKGRMDDPNVARGAWFIKELVLACEMFAHVDHIGDLVTKAIRLLQNRKVEFGEVQTAQFDSSLRKKLYFFPGYYAEAPKKKRKRCVIM